MGDTMTLDELKEAVADICAGCDTQRSLFTNAQLADAIDAAIKQREQDAARLDWMDAHPRLATIVIDGHPTECYFYGVSGAAGLKLREIIDATMVEGSGNV